MNQTEFQKWYEQLQLVTEARELIARIRAVPPERRVQGRAGNVSGTYPSRKMGVTIQFESHTVELWAIYQMEHDPLVLEFYDQPPKFKIQYISLSGRKIAHYHTPDFFVLRTDSAAWEEWKTEKQLEKLTQKYPSRYQRTESGKWRCPPGEAYAEQFGLEYRVQTDAQLHPTFIQNLMFLEDYLTTTTTVPAPIETRIRQRVGTAPGITLAALMAEEPGVRANDVYLMIATEQLYVDLSAVPLAEHWRVQLYPDQQRYIANRHLAIKLPQNFHINPNQLKANSKLLWDGRLWTLLNLGETTTTLLPELGQPMSLPTGFFLQLLDSGAISIPNTTEETTISEQLQTLMNAASPFDLKTANQRYQKVQAYLQREKELYQDIAPRTLSRWVKQFRQAEALYGCGYVGLLPKTAQKGNRTPKAPETARELLDTFIKEHFQTPRQAPAASIYRAYQQACDQQNITPLSIRRFYQRIKQQKTPEATAARLGTKVAYSEQPWVWELKNTTPRHGDRPLAIAHIDHTQLDIELRCSTTGRNLGRPWATFLMDAYSRRILAVYLTLDAPSYRSCMMVLRICVQRFGRFPQALVVDGGKEFHSVYFDTLLARYHCIKKTRPGAQPRFGSVIERLFGTTNTELVFNLLGNTQAAKQVRQMTKAIDPKRQAVWTLGDLYTYLIEWAYQIYDHNSHEVLGMSPREAYIKGLQQTGEREHRRIPYSEDFLMATRPTTRNGVARVQPGRGIKVNYIYYWSDAFRHPEVERTSVPVRYDPFDMGTAYAYVQGRWVKCISQYYTIFSKRSEKELLLAATEIRQLAKLHRTSSSISAKRLADFLSTVQEHEALLVQRLRDLEARSVLHTLTEEPDSVQPSEVVMTTAAKFPISVPTSDETNAVVQPFDLTQLPVFEEYR